MHRRGYCRLFAGLLMAFSVASMAHADTIAERQELYEKVRRLIKVGDFKGLDQLAELERRPTAIDSSGVPYLEALYADLEGEASIYAPKLSCGLAQRRIAEDWLKSDPKSITAHIIYAEALISLGFCARGFDSADKVPPDQWSIFKTYISQAHEYLYSHRDDSQKDPEWFSTAEEIATYQGWNESEFDNLLRKASAEFPSYYPIWYQGMIYYSARWNGSDDQVENFAKYSTDETRTLFGPDMYARLYRWMGNLYQLNDLKSETNVDWKYMKVSMRDIVSKYPDIMNLEAFAYVNCKAMDYMEMDYYIDKMFTADRDTWGWKITSRQGQCDRLWQIRIIKRAPTGGTRDLQVSRRDPINTALARPWAAAWAERPRRASVQTPGRRESAA